MAIANEPTSIELLRNDERARTRFTDARFVPNAADFDDHLKTYRGFIRVAALFIAHVALILLLLAWFFLR